MEIQTKQGLWVGLITDEIRDLLLPKEEKPEEEKPVEKKKPGRKPKQ